MDAFPSQQIRGCLTKEKGLVLSFPLRRGGGKARKSYICRKETECSVRFRSPEPAVSVTLLHPIAIYDDPFLEMDSELEQ